MLGQHEWKQKLPRVPFEHSYFCCEVESSLLLCVPLAWHFVKPYCIFAITPWLTSLYVPGSILIVRSMHAMTIMQFIDKYENHIQAPYIHVSLPHTNVRWQTVLVSSMCGFINVPS